MDRGTYQIIRADGTERTVAERPTLATVREEIGADWVDTVTLDRAAKTVMIVDDTGLISGRRVNWRATELARRAGLVGPIHGDVAIVNDGDFA